MPTNALDRRIHKIVKLLVAEKRTENDKVTFEIKLVFDHHQPLWLRILCSVLIITSSSLLLYQCADRFTYYLSYPVNVDVNIEEMENMFFPEIIVASPYTSKISEMMMAKGFQLHDMDACFKPIYVLMQINQWNMTYLWGAANTSSVVVKHDIVHGKEVTKLEMNSQDTPYALASKFRSSKQFSMKGKTVAVNIHLAPPKPACVLMAIYVMLIGRDGAIDYQNHKRIAGGHINVLELSVKQYRFINRRAFSCVEDEKTYEHCMQKCRLMLYKELPCRFPYMPLETGLPMCNIDGVLHYWKARNIYMGTHTGFPLCQCIRPCRQTFYEMFSVPLGKTEFETEVVVKFLNTFTTITTERQAYDFISFLADTGGNMGLCLGLSILDLIYWLHYLATKNRHPKIDVFKNNDPIYQIVRKTFMKITCKILNTSQNNCCKITPKVLFVFLFAIFTACLILFRFENFIRFPKTTILTVNDSVLVQYPVVTFCWESGTVTNCKKELAKMHKSKTDACKVTLLDLMDAPFFHTADKVWEYSYTHDIFVAGSMAPYLKVVPTLFPYGNCTSYTSEPVSHAVTHADFLLIRRDSTKDCDRSVKVIVTQPGDIIDPTKYEVIPEVSGSSVQFLLQILQTNEVSPNENASNASYACKKLCIMKKMMINLPCRMPYVEDAGNLLQPCNTTVDAKRAEVIYMDAFASSDPHRECGCPARHQTLIYTTTVLINPLEMGPTGMEIIFTNSRIETLFKVYSYSGEKFVSQMGGIVSSILGLSVIYLAEILIKFYDKKYKKPVQVASFIQRV